MNEIDGEAEYLTCAKEYIESYFTQQDIDYIADCVNTDPCYFPFFGSAVNSSLQYCPTLRDYLCSWVRLNNALLKVTVMGPDVPCLKPKVQSKFDVSMHYYASTPYIRDQQNQLVFYMESMDVTIEEEYQLLDIFAVTAAIGGSIGIFIGWSCMDLVRAMLSLLDKFIW